MTHWLIGAYGADMDGTSLGISLMTSRADGSLEYAGLVAEVQSPTFLAQSGDHVYAAAEGSERVVAFRRAGTALEFDSEAPSGGVWPCQLEFIDGAVVASNYSTGGLGVVSLGADGSVGELLQVLEGEGSGPHKEQDGPHAHASFRLDATTLLSADLGADRILIHEIDGANVRRTGEVVLAGGTGPRDIARHPSGLIYVLGEHGRVLIVFEFVDGMLVPVSSTPLPGAQPTDQAAAIAFGAGGCYVYAGLRGSNLISVLRASDDGRELEPVGSVSTEGQWPRHLVVDADVLHVANEHSHTIASFRLADDGMPSLIGSPTTVASPTYLLPIA